MNTHGKEEEQKKQDKHTFDKVTEGLGGAVRASEDMFSTCKLEDLIRYAKVKYPPYIT